VEALLDDPFDAPTGYGVGASDPVADATDRYAAFVASSTGPVTGGVRLVMDCAHGAASAVAGPLFQRLGVDYTLVSADPNGVNINVRCGSTHLDHVASEVRRGGFDVGLAVDGDADRLLAVDAAGGRVDGDHILAILARDLLGQGLLDHNLVVVTSMANLGLRRALAGLGCRIIVTDVGDRYVLEAMRREGAVLGGEQSGHLISLRHTTTGDGLLTAAALLAALGRAGQDLTDAAALVTKYPQELVSVRADRTRLDEAERVWAVVRETEAALGDDGRVVLRASGTEPLVRVMVEAADADTCARHAAVLVEVVQAELGLD
jgi:phosphoglucosamine mutase